MRIILVRHGKPGDVSAAPITGHQVGQWVRHYNNAGITREVAPPTVLCDLAASAGCVLVSSLRRARESAGWLASSKEVRVDPELCEAVLPESLAIPLRLSPGIWVVLARLAWWLNWSRSDESLAMTRRRASRIADRLGALAAKHGSVMAIGHGMFNRFVARQLRVRGWRGPKWLPRAYWAVAEYEYATHNGDSDGNVIQFREHPER